MRFFGALLRVLGWLMTFVTAVLFVLLGVLLTFMTQHQIYDAVDRIWKDWTGRLPAGLPYREILGGLLAVLGLLAFLSMFVRRGKRRRRSISFSGTHGDVTIELEHVEDVLKRVAKKLPEVKDVSIRLEPTDARSRVLVLAECVLMKDADAEARQVTDRVQEYIKVHTRKILGVQDVDVRLKVRKFLLNMRSVKPMPLLLEGPRPQAAANPGYAASGNSGDSGHGEIELDRDEDRREEAAQHS